MNPILDIFEQTVSKFEKKIAVQDETNQMTYLELMQNAKVIGYALNCELKGVLHKPVIIFMDKSCICLAALLGTIYSGNIYVPMDVKTPIERLNSIIETLESDVIITSKEEKESLIKIGYQGEILVYEELIAGFINHVKENVLTDIRKRMIDTDLMYMIFTSGSTGVPKGVAVMYRSLVDYIHDFLEEVNLESDDIVGNQTPFYADMSLKDIYMTLTVGATICIIPQKYFMVPKKLLQYLDDNRVSFIAWVPTAYRIVSQFDGLSKVKPCHLKKFLFSGEAMPVSVINYWKKYYKDSIWIQQYGPTEITGACTSFKVERDYGEGETIPIGKAFRNTGIILLDNNDKEIESNNVDTVGEICVYGTCLAAGYYNNPEKTREVFVQNPLVKTHESKMYRTGDLAKWDKEGNLVFISRKDYQVKHGGKRIELGEIETAVDSVNEVKACCCVHNAKNDALILYYIGDISDKDIKKRIVGKLPKYMVPTVYKKMEKLPTLSNGKLDRKLLNQWG